MAKHKGDTEKSPDGLGIMMSAYDWIEAMQHAKENFEFKDVDKIIFEREGDNDVCNWLLIVLLKTGKYGWLSAGCDYSGWGCREWGESGIVDTEQEARDIINKKLEEEKT